MEKTKTVSPNNISEHPLIPAATAIETFRDAGYKSTASALAELIDNSIEAGAENIQVLTFEESIQRSKRTLYSITRVAIYDDGQGMDFDTLQMALQFGVGTRMHTRKGMGRFGIGLPNASVSQCRHVDVYSWREGKCHKTHLDVDETKKYKIQNANSVSPCELPVEILDEVENGYDKESGTLVVWSKCDRLDISRSKTLYKNMERDLCRIYRHFLDSDTRYGRRVNLKLVVTGKERTIHELRANDPLYLLKPNNVPGYENEITNESHGNVTKLEIPYDEDGNTSVVEVRFSIALPETQSLFGGSKLGKHYGHNTGISFVRACREIDFGDFGFFNSRDERERWWGCEIRFEPVLDELFGVTNNKQSIHGIKYLDEKEFKKEHGEDWEEEFKENFRLNLRHQLSKVFKSNHSTMWETIKGRGKSSRSGKASTPSTATRIANEQLENSTEETKSKIESKLKTEEEKKDEWLKKLEEQSPELPESELNDLADQKSHLKIDIDYGSWPGEQFFSIETYGETPVVTLNKKHAFYTDLYEPLSKENPSLTDAIDLLVMAYARTEEELYSYSDELEKIRSRWGGYVQDFLKRLKKSA